MKTRWKITTVEQRYPPHCHKCDPDFKAKPVWNVWISTGDGGFGATGTTLPRALQAARRRAATWWTTTIDVTPQNARMNSTRGQQAFDHALAHFMQSCNLTRSTP